MQSLAELAREGALVVGGNVLDFGLQTTPQLHHLVRMVGFVLTLPFILVCCYWAKANDLVLLL